MSRKNETTSDRVASKASRVLRDPKASPDAKSAAGSALAQVADPVPPTGPQFIVPAGDNIGAADLRVLRQAWQQFNPIELTEARGQRVEAWLDLLIAQSL